MPRADFVAGNTRLRARIPALLGPTEYDHLAGIPRRAAVERLEATTYGPYLNHDLPDSSRLLDAVGRRLRNLLRGVCGLYGGTADTVVGVLLGRHDLQDTFALLRGARTGQPRHDRLAALMGVGALDRAAAADVAAAPDGAAAILRLAARGLPDPRTARALSAAWQRYELNADPDEFETTIASTAISGWTARLKHVGPAGRPARMLVDAECDRANVLAVLRDSVVETPRLLPIGQVTEPALLAAQRGDLRPVATARPGWREALDRYARNKDLTPLEWDLAAQLWRRTIRCVRRGDPLGADVPVGYVIAAECEARAVRLLLADAMPASEVRNLLLG